MKENDNITQFYRRDQTKFDFEEKYTETAHLHIRK